MRKVIVVYPGGFQPFHQGHLDGYLQAKKAFPNAEFYIAASNSTKKRPLPFEEKRFLAIQAGVDPEDFPSIVVKKPLSPSEILNNYNPNKDIFILVRSERDPMSYTNKDGSPGYHQPLTKKTKLQPFGKHAYVFVTKKKDFDINGIPVESATQLRNMYAGGNEAQRINIIKKLYPTSKRKKTIKRIMDQYLSNKTTQKIAESINKLRAQLNSASPEQKVKALASLYKAKDALTRKNKPVSESPDYLPEK